MGVLSYGRRQLTLLQQKKFDLAVSLYNIDHGLGYSNIDTLAWASKAKSIRGYSPRGTHVDLTGKSILKKSILEKTTFFWVVLNYLATGVLFSIITLKSVREPQTAGEVAEAMTQV